MTPLSFTPLLHPIASSRWLHAIALTCPPPKPTMTPSANALNELATTLRQACAQREFSGLWFWRSAVLRPGDDSLRLLDCQPADSGATPSLLLILQQASQPALAQTLQVWQPGGLQVSADGVRLWQAQQLRFAQTWGRAVAAEPPQGGPACYQFTHPGGQFSASQADGKHLHAALWLSC